MFAPFNRLAKILRTKPEALLDLSEKMSSITGQEKVIEKIVEENDLLVHKTLLGLGLLKENSAEEIREALQAKIIDLDKKLPGDWQGLCDAVLDLISSPSTHATKPQGGEPVESTGSGQSQTTGFFIKKEKAVELLSKYPPQNLLDFLGYKNVGELIEKESFESVFAALRFTQSAEWMHKFFDEAYSGLKADDFEERPIQVKILEEKWLDVADKFLEKKYHNVSHLKELGIIFIVPLKLDTPGETLRIFTLLLHYLNEVPFYSKLFRKFSQGSDFIENLKSLLRGDVVENEKLKIKPSSRAQVEENEKLRWLIIQRYLAKDDGNDPRLFMPHVNPEAEHWYKAQESLAKLGPDFAFWRELDFAGGFFESELVSFDLIDQVMTLVKKGEAKYLYHQQEALWNKIFAGYFGREKMNELIEENIIKGYIEL
ncbi:MAG: hypothetical protein HY451_02055 [Parcubacteria group bacterium]|nr:hypothetical protein [Parcubacteria group bacterium]